ncbi:IS1096%2C tnpA protein [Mycobacteroides abscessus]|nr:IS1096%2C tnpA protein [Mycobacteroides abscessus]
MSAAARVQLATCGHRGRKSDPLYTCRRTLHTGADLLTDRQRTRLAALFAADAHAEVEATWQMYQRTVAAYREPDRTKGRTMMAALITTLSTGVPKPLTELITLGRTLKKRAADVLAYFDRPGTSNGPTEAINGRLEHLRGSALGFRNLTNYIARSLLETGGFRNSAPCTSAVKSPQRIFDAARASLVSVTEKRSGCQPRGSQSRISCAPSPIGVARGSYPPRTHAANSS